MNILTPILKEFGLSEAAKRVFFDLLDGGDSPARTIAERTGMTRPSVYDQLRVLEDIGLVAEREVEGRATFAIHDLDNIQKLLNEKLQMLMEIKKVFETQKHALISKHTITQPRIKFFEGKDGLTRLYRDMLWESDTLIETVWPHRMMERVLGSKELTSFNARRIRHKIRIRAIWPHGSSPKRVGVWEGGDWGVERRVAPKGFSFEMQYSIFGDKVAFISSEREHFGFVVSSKEFADLMRTQFQAMWGISKN